MSTNGHGPAPQSGLTSFWDAELQQHSCLLCWTPPDFSAETCGARSRAGKICTREPGHLQAHAACGPAVHTHPIEIWED